MSSLSISPPLVELVSSSLHQEFHRMGEKYKGDGDSDSISSRLENCYKRSPLFLQHVNKDALCPYVGFSSFYIEHKIDCERTEYSWYSGAEWKIVKDEETRKWTITHVFSEFTIEKKSMPSIWKWVREKVKAGYYPVANVELEYKYHRLIEQQAWTCNYENYALLFMKEALRERLTAARQYHPY